MKERGRENTKFQISVSVVRPHTFFSITFKALPANRKFVYLSKDALHCTLVREREKGSRREDERKRS